MYRIKDLMKFVLDQHFVGKEYWVDPTTSDKSLEKSDRHTVVKKIDNCQIYDNKIVLDYTSNFMLVKDFAELLQNKLKSLLQVFFNNTVEHVAIIPKNHRLEILIRTEYKVKFYPINHIL